MAKNHCCALYEQGGEFKCEERDIPQAPPNGAVVKVKYCGICFADCHIWRHGHSFFPPLKFPWIPGHEIAGEIYALGQDSNHENELKVGDHVVIYPFVACQSCSYCKNNEQNKCPMCIGVSFGFTMDGGYQEYLCVGNTKFLVRVPDRLPLDVACILPCSGLTAYAAILQAEQHVKDVIQHTGECRLLMVGAGGLGLWAVIFAKKLLAAQCKIIMATSNEKKLKAAKSLGADVTLSWPRQGDKDDLIALTVKESGGPIHVCLDFVNSQQTVTILQQVTAMAGYWIMMGVMEDQVQVSMYTIVLKNLTLASQLVGGLNIFKDLVKFVDKHQIKGPPTEKVLPSDITSAHRRLNKGEVIGRGIISFQ